jgi:hypothetical protein
MLVLLVLLALLGLCNEAGAFVLTLAPTKATTTTTTATTTASGSGLRTTRRMLLSMQTALTTATFRGQQSLAESQIALMKSQEQERELIRLLNEAVTRNAAMNPRAVIEYVELFVMPSDAEYIKTKDRRQKWEAFLKDENTRGPNIVRCLLDDVPTWSTAAKAAAQISNLYSYTSEGAHVTSHEIADNPLAPIRIDEGPSLLLQGGKAMLCIGRVLEIGIELKRK